MLATDIGNLFVPIAPLIPIDKVCAPPADGIVRFPEPTAATVPQFIVLPDDEIVAVAENTILEPTLTGCAKPKLYVPGGVAPS
jgi:hypothetical protein